MFVALPRAWLRFVGIFVVAFSLLALLRHSQNGKRADHSRDQQHEQSSSTSGHVDIMSDSWRKGFSIEQFNAKFELITKNCASGKGPCPRNGHKLVLLTWVHCEWLLRGGLQGENIWCGSMMDSLHALGYSMLVVKAQEIRQVYRKYHENVHLVIGDPIADCVYDSTCVYADLDSQFNAEAPVPKPNSTHLNMPIWKLFHPVWWNHPVEPLGGPFTLSPEPFNIWPEGLNAGKDNYYLGYSVESSCMKTAYVPHQQRPLQAYIFGKRLRYFMTSKYLLWDPKKGIEGALSDDIYLELARTENITFLAGKFDLTEAIDDRFTDPPPGIIEHGRVTRDVFQKVVSESRAMIGLGDPLLSPTPYEALCLGIPFIHPVYYTNPKDRSTWDGQHVTLIHEGLDEPYVYHVNLGDRKAFKAALRKAMHTPIERYIPPRMTSAALVERMKILLETNWRPVARRQIEITGYKYRS